MSIRLKLLAAVLITFTILFVALAAVSYAVISISFDELEQHTVRDNVERVMNTVADNIRMLGATTADYAFWSDTYAFAQGQYDDFVDDNFSSDNATLGNLGINLALIADADGRFVWHRAIDLETLEAVALSEELEAALTQILRNSPPEDSVSWGFEGLLPLPDRLIMIASRAILTTAQQGPAAGTLVFGVFVDATTEAALSQTLKLPIRISMIDESGTLPDTIATWAGPQTEGAEGYMVQALNADTIAGYAVLNDLAGEPTALVQIEMPRAIYQQGQDTFTLLVVLLIVTGAVLSIIMYVLLNATIVARITRLSAEVGSIGETGMPKNQVTVESDDEVTTLSRSINRMLNRLDMAQRDIQQRNDELEQAYKEAREATRLKSEFLSTMSHELRTPLNAVIGYAGIMLAGIGGQIDDEARRMITNIYGSSTHLLSLVNDVLDLSKIEAGRMELVDADFSLRGLVSEIQQRLQVLADRKGLAFIIEYDELLPDGLRGDEARLGQMITNLLSNAIKFTEKGHVRLCMKRAGDELMIAVEDTGIGIPPHALNYIFDEFRQADGTIRRSYQGTGLGLSIVRKLTEAMGGRLNVVSAIDNGSVFTIHLPLRLASEVRAQSA